MTKYYLVFAICALLALGVTASASTGPSFFGPTGLITMPTTDSLGMGEARVFGNFVTRNSEAAYGVNVGLGFGLEVGATQVHETGASAGTENIVNVKWTAIKGGLLRPSVAIGAINVAENKGFVGSFIVTDRGKIDPFIVVGKSIGIPGVAKLSANAGFIGGSLNKGMLGAKLSLASKVDLMADYIPGFSGLSVGARYNAPSGLSIQAAMIDGDFAAGIAYTRGLGK